MATAAVKATAYKIILYVVTTKVYFAAAEGDSGPCLQVSSGKQYFEMYVSQVFSKTFLF
jgi:hypothetical protein